MDILIVDENYPAAYFLKEDDFVVANKDAVICAIEVKSKLNKKNFCDIIEKCNSVKVMDEKIDFFSFCFRGTISNDRIVSLYDEVSFDHVKENYPNLISIMNRGCLYRKPEDKQLGHWLLVPALMKDNVIHQSLSIFIASIVKSCFAKCNIEKNPYSLYKSSLVARYGGNMLRFG